MLSLAKTRLDGLAARKFVDNMCCKCEVCSIGKEDVGEGLDFIEVNETSDGEAVDMFGSRLQQANAHSKCVKVAVDYFSRYAETETVRSPTSVDIEEFIADWIRKHGRIGMLVAGSDSQFTSPGFAT